jgi:hypothetical protein
MSHPSSSSETCTKTYNLLAQSCRNCHACLSTARVSRAAARHSLVTSRGGLLSPPRPSTRIRGLIQHLASTALPTTLQSCPTPSSTSAFPRSSCHSLSFQRLHAWQARRCNGGQVRGLGHNHAPSGYLAPHTARVLHNRSNSWSTRSSARSPGCAWASVIVITLQRGVTPHQSS